jgi:trans-aconitate methyltransferase
MSEDSEMKTVMKEMINVMKELVKFMQKIEPLQAGGTLVDTLPSETSNMQHVLLDPRLEQHKFSQKFQQEGESITNFVANLKMAAVNE